MVYNVAVVFKSRVVSESPRKICRGIKDLDPSAEYLAALSSRVWKVGITFRSGCVMV